MINKKQWLSIRERCIYHSVCECLTGHPREVVGSRGDTRGLLALDYSMFSSPFLVRIRDFPSARVV